MYGYVYKGTNLVNNKIYIGQHKATKFDEKYHGSGTLWRRACAKYGLENIKIELLEWCKTRQELNDREAYYIKTFNSQDILVGYNILGDDKSPHSCSGEKNGMYGKHHSEETKKKLSEIAKRRPKKTKEEYLKQGRPGVPKSEEHKKAISAALKGRRPSGNTLLSVKKANSKPFEIFDMNYIFVLRVDRQKDLLAFLNITYFNKELKECIHSKKPYRGYYIRYV